MNLRFTSVLLLSWVAATAPVAAARSGEAAGWATPATLAQPLRLAAGAEILAVTKPWTSGQRELVAALFTAGNSDVSLALFEQEAGAPVLVAELPAIGHRSATIRTTFDADQIQVAPDELLVGVREDSTVGAQEREVLRLVRIDGTGLRVVFERVVFSGSPAGADGSRTGCEASVAADDLGTPPFPLKVTERCAQTGRTSSEMWRWDGKSYALHGPASDAAVSEDLFTKTPAVPPG